MKNIMWDPLPRVYEMSWRGQTESLELGINSQVVDEVFNDPKACDWPIAKYTQKEYKLGELTADPEIGFGFDPCRLMRRGNHGDFAVFALHLPQIEVEGGECQHCKGKSRRSRQECFACDGSGKSREFRHRLGMIATINLSLLLSRLLFPELQRIETDGSQLMTIELSAAERSLHGFPLWGAFSPQMVRWIGSHQQQTDLPLVRSAMKEALVRMCPSFRRDSGFHAWLEPDGGVQFSGAGELRVPVAGIHRTGMSAAKSWLQLRLPQCGQPSTTIVLARGACLLVGDGE